MVLAALFVILLSLPPLAVLLHHLHAHLDDVHVRLEVAVAAPAAARPPSTFFRELENQLQGDPSACSIPPVDLKMRFAP